VEAILNIERHALSKNPDTTAGLLDSTIDEALSKLTELETQPSGRLSKFFSLQRRFDMLTVVDEFYLTCARLQVLSFHLFTPRASINDAKLMTLYGMACKLVEVAMDIDRLQNFSEFAPHLLSCFLNLAAFSVLKISRSHIRDALDLMRGQRLYARCGLMPKVRSSVLLCIYDCYSQHL
jgi:hypothetical protein